MINEYIKTYEQWAFSKAENDDLPSSSIDQFKNKGLLLNDVEKTKTLIFDPNDEYHYPFVIKGKLHGLESHALKHFYEFNPQLYNNFIDSSKDYIIKYMNDDLKIINIKGEIDDDITDEDQIEDLHRYNIINALDFINDKIYKDKELSKIEIVLYNKIIKPISQQYWTLIDKIINHGISIRDYRKEMINRPVYFNVFRPGGNEYMYFYDPTSKAIVVTNVARDVIYSCYKMTSRTIYDYFTSQKSFSKKCRPNNEMMGFLRTYGR